MGDADLGVEVQRLKAGPGARAASPIVTLDLDGTIRSASRSIQLVFGWKPSELIGRNLRVLIAGPHRSAHAEHLRRHARSKSPEVPSIPVRLDGQHKDGSVFPIELRLARAIARSSRLSGIIRPLGPHTEQELAEARARLAGEFAALTRLQDLSTSLVSHGDPRSLFGNIVDAAVAITGSDAGMLHLLDRESETLTVEAHRGLSSRWQDRGTGARHTLTVRALGLRRGIPVVVEDLARRPVLAGPLGLPALLGPTGGESHFTPLMSRGGRFLGILSTHSRFAARPGGHEPRLMDVLARQAADFIDRTRARDDLLRSESQHRAIINTAADAILTIDARGVIQSANSATERLFGYRAGEMIGRGVGMLMPAPHRDAHAGYIAEYLRTGVKRVVGLGREVTARRSDGSEFHADLAVSEVIPGKLFAGALRDLTERKLAEARARQADRMASIGTLAAGLGHDMNNVLLPVRARLNALRAAGQSGKIADAELDHVDGIHRSIAYLQQLADGLHFLAMDPETQGPADSAAATDLGAWWLQAGPLLSKAVPKHVRVTASIPAGLPRAAVAPHALSQAILNLVVNAGAAIPAGRQRRQGSVRIWAEVAAKGSLRIGVTDNGCGMSAEVKRRAFELFFTTKSRGLGTGLGLPLVRKVAEQARGSVEIESQPGRGTTVVLTFPITASALQARAGAARGPLAVITLKDGRAAAFAGQLLEASGVRVKQGGTPDGSDIWVVDPTAVQPRDAKGWRDAHPRGRLVLLGLPGPASAAAWGLLRPIRIEQPDDLGVLRRALAEVLTPSA